MSPKKTKLIVKQEEEEEEEKNYSQETDIFGLANRSTQEISEEILTEPLAYLQGLNSGNLMQYSQQSLLRDMMMQDLKSQINSLPKLENHAGDYLFDMKLGEPPKSHWVFSEQLNKLYIRMNRTFNIDARFKVQLPFQPLNLRAFLCFVKDVSGPVLRCQNHLSTDSIKDNVSMRESLIRCENPNTSYCGTANGKSIVERYSVLVPLNMSRATHQGNGFVRQTLAFSFACQNSCFGRKETCLVFCLENMSGDIVGQTVLDVKICTCPKRDRNIDERNWQSSKRKTMSGASEEEDGDEPHGRKIRRRTSLRDIKDENESNDSYDTSQALPTNWDVSCSVDGNYRLVVNCAQKDMLLEGIEGMIEKAAVAVLRSPQDSKLRQHANQLVNLKNRALKL